jgi:K+-sensing histidine kinase KdpD
MKLRGKATFRHTPFILAFLVSTLAIVAFLYYISRYSSNEVSRIFSGFWNDAFTPMWNYILGGASIKMPDATPIADAMSKAESKRFLYTALGVVGINAVVASAFAISYKLLARRRRPLICDDVLVNMSHDIRTPINGIVGLSETLAEDEADESRLECLTAIGDSGKTLLRIVNDVLDLAKMESGRMSVDSSDVNIAELVGEAASAIGAGCMSKSINMSMHVADGTPSMARTDGGKLLRVLLNLLNNSLKNTDEGEISIRVAGYKGQRRGNLLFSVSDTGSGIEEERLAAMMKGVHRSVDPGADGNGLGLPVSIGLVTLMGGEIWAESVPGRGSSFHFTISA